MKRSRLAGDYVMGVHSGINASAAIGSVDGRLLYAVQEERIAREKNYVGFPERAVRACLEYVAARPDDIAVAAHGSRRLQADHIPRASVRSLFEAHQATELTPERRTKLRAYLDREYARSPGQFAERLGDLGVRPRQVRVYDHHSTHADAAYFGLRADPGETYLVMTCDGAGDEACATVATYRDGVRVELSRSGESASPGLVYLWTTLSYGFRPHEDEHKLMGMAPYADPAQAERIAQVFRDYVGLDGLQFRCSRGDVQAQWPVVLDALGRSRFDHVFGGVQRYIEKLISDWIRSAVAQSGIKHVLGSGGVFMNVKMNGALAALPELDSFSAFPSCGDETLSIGAFYRAAHELGALVPALPDMFLGDEPGPIDETPHAMADGLAVTAESDIDTVVAELLAAGEIVARCVGRMEFGARALGNRSLLAPAADRDYVWKLNQAVKQRDFWMPFAPMVLADRLCEYLRAPHGERSPFMMTTYDTVPDAQRSIIAAIHPADGSARAQIVYERENPTAYRLLKRYESLTGSGVLLNTSLNIHGEPIVRTAQEAVQVLRVSGLRYLALHRHLVLKKQG